MCTTCLRSEYLKEVEDGLCHGIYGHRLVVRLAQSGNQVHFLSTKHRRTKSGPVFGGRITLIVLSQKKPLRCGTSLSLASSSNVTNEPYLNDPAQHWNNTSVIPYPSQYRSKSTPPPKKVGENQEHPRIDPKKNQATPQSL